MKANAYDRRTIAIATACQAGNIGAAPHPRNRHSRRLASMPAIGQDSVGAGDRRRVRVVEEGNMAGVVEKRLAELGIILPTPTTPVANYVPFVRTRNILVCSGQICFDADGKLLAKGKLGGGISIEEGQKAARACAINLLAQVKAAVGDLDKLSRVIRLGGFINSMPDFVDGPKVMNGASDLMVAALGDKGRHARTTVGVAVLPLDAAVEVEGIFEVE
jgi:enamine deaminase RidA (YjgF/YER057c/UK114 family)